MEDNSRTKDAEFEQFWTGWRPFDMDKGSKAKARTSYDKARKETAHEHLIATRDAYLSSCHAREQRTKHAVSWLNARGWEDDYRPNGQHQNKKTSYLDKIQDAGARALEVARARMEAENFEPWGEQGQIQPPGPPLRLTEERSPLSDGDRQQIPEGVDGALCPDT